MFSEIVKLLEFYFKLVFIGLPFFKILSGVAVVENCNILGILLTKQSVLSFHNIRNCKNFKILLIKFGSASSLFVILSGNVKFSEFY